MLRMEQEQEQAAVEPMAEEAVMDLGVTMEPREVMQVLI
jgi:hypothetical protein